MVGVNKYVLDEPIEIPILAMDPQGEARQMERLARSCAASATRTATPPPWTACAQTARTPTRTSCPP